MEQCNCKKTDKILSAYIEAKRTIEKPTNLKRNTHFKYDYVPLEEWYRVSEQSLKDQNIYILHNNRVCVQTGKTIAVTKFWHKESGQEIVDERYYIQDKGNAQSHGSDDTYFKRYAMRSLIGFGIGDDDDDGEEGRKHQERVSLLGNYIKARCNIEFMDRIKTEYNIDTLSQLDNGSLFDVFVLALKNNK